jgi:hypothetical protein
MTWSPVELVERLRTLDETVRIEAKKGVGKSVRETVSAFANEPDLGGGWVVFGVVRDSSGTYRVVGVSDPDTVQADLATQCRDQFNRALRPDIRVAEVESRTVVAAFVPEADPRDKPVYVRSVGLPRGRSGESAQLTNDSPTKIWRRSLHCQVGHPLTNGQSTAPRLMISRPMPSALPGKSSVWLNPPLSFTAPAIRSFSGPSAHWSPVAMA